MNSPAAALTWEIWCRHRKRLLAVFFVILGFAVFYSKLCASIGLNLDSPNAFDSLAEQALPTQGTGPEIVRLVAWLFLICAPLGCMILTLFYVVWISTFTDLNVREPFSFPKRFFTLPISTRFLATRLMASGTVAVLLVYLGWTRLVHLPHLDVLDGFHDGLAWITLLILSQAIVWSLDAFPFTRMLLLIVAAFCLLAHPDFQWYRSLSAHQTVLQLSLLVIGCRLAFVGLDKIRHGNWQVGFWRSWLPSLSARKVVRHRQPFASPARAQFWFEWRRQGRKTFYCVCALAVVPVLVMIPELLLHPGAVSGETTSGLCVYLLAVPLFIHFFHGVSHERTMPQFTANRPLNNGGIIVAQWQAMALSTVLSWVVTLLLVGVVALVGDLSVINSTLCSPPAYQHLIRPLIPVILLGLIISTWASGADRVWVWATMGTWIHRVYVTVIFAVLGLGLAWVFAVTHKNTLFRENYFQILPGLLACLVALKFFLAQGAFRSALKQQLLTQSTLLKYLFLWTAMALFLLVPTVVVGHQDKGMLPIYPLLILLLPLARIGFAPIALKLGRHR